MLVVNTLSLITTTISSNIHPTGDRDGVTHNISDVSTQRGPWDLPPHTLSRKHNKPWIEDASGQGRGVQCIHRTCSQEELAWGLWQVVGQQCILGNDALKLFLSHSSGLIWERADAGKNKMAAPFLLPHLFRPLPAYLDWVSGVILTVSEEEGRIHQTCIVVKWEVKSV